MRAVGAQIVGGHHNIEEYNSAVVPGDLVMTTVRNHWDWFVSFWYLNGCPGKFDRYVPRLCRESEWINRNPDCTQCKLFWKYVPLSTVILRYERVGLDINQALSSRGFPTLTLQQEGKKKPRRYQTYYRRGMEDYIMSRFGAEIQHYGYTF